MIQNFDLSLNKKTYLSNEFFHLFEIDNFLPEDQYTSLLNSFPSDKYFIGSDNTFGKDTFSCKDKNFKNFLDENKNWKFLFEAFNNIKFLKSAFFSSLIPNLKSRGLGALKIWTLDKKKIPFLLRPFFRELEVTFMFTKLRGKKNILPHTDIPSKFLSMIYYFPNNDWTKKNMGNTVFWKNINNAGNWKNWENKHVSIDQYEDFKADHVVFHQAKYSRNKLVGFVKTENSWHSVDKIDLNTNDERQTLNIFVRIKKK